MLNSSEVHSYYFDFEDRHSIHELQDWCRERNNWPALIIPVYLVAIHYGQKVMRDRKPFNLKSLLFAWNAGLALFSIIGTIRLFANIRHQVANKGFSESVCINEPDNVVSLWVYLFTMSKFAELGDTLFLVMRQRKVLFLHWYHHVTVLLFTWSAFVQNASTGRYFILMNFFVHSLMYTYYALQTIGIRAPKFVSMTITSLQIAQMVGGIAVLAAAQYNVMYSGKSCTAPLNILISGLLMYGSYFALFVQFFVRAYLSNQRRIQRQKSNAAAAAAWTAAAAAAATDGKVDACNNNITTCGKGDETSDANSNHIKVQ